jgi:hypothetical protein
LFTAHLLVQPNYGDNTTAQMKKSKTENRLGAHSCARKIWLRMKPNTGYKIRKATSNLSLLMAQNAGPVLSPRRPEKSRTKLRTKKVGRESKEEPKAGKNKSNHGQHLPWQKTKADFTKTSQI